ncbi:sensor histidine kinase [Streptosporangium sp. NPDC000396]|uniref:sensor histidine kinase n=1 Tax=Streptosporangium sp. NPDC000396 TaxID=3366185 RepID=UPI0036AC854A
MNGRDVDDSGVKGESRGEALRYLCATLPMLVVGGFWILSADSRKVAPDLARIAPDVALCGAGLALMRWRHRFPWQIALVTGFLTLSSITAAGPAYVTYVSLCTHRRWRQIIPVALAVWLCPAAQVLWWDVGRLRVMSVTSVTIVTGCVIVGGLTVFGLYLRARRDLAASQRQAAFEAQAQRVEQARLSERVQIAHEMHDVLAHRISLLAMLAGGLAHRTDLTADQTREAAQAIQENAHQSLNELRAVLGTLRRDGIEDPQPSLVDLDALFDEVRVAGQQVEVGDTIDGRELLPAQTGRHAYRIVQEALTNARKHAPGSRVRAELGGRPGQGLWIRISNPAPYWASSGPGGRLGLVGLAERARMAGGTMSHAVQDGRFVLDVRLPWEA